MPNLISIGETIRELRKEKGYTQDGLGQRVGCTKSTLSKIENGERSPTLDMLVKLAEKLGTDLNYILRDALETEDYQLAAVKSFINRFVKITTASRYFDKNNDAVLKPEEFVFSLLAGTDFPLILQLDDSLVNFAKNVAETESIKQTLDENEYNNRILSAMRRLNKSESGEKVNSYCLASIQDIESIIGEAVKREVAVLQALEKSYDDEID